MRIALNLATKPFTDVGPAIKQMRQAMAVLALLAIVLGLSLRIFHVKAEEARQRDHSLDSQIAKIQQERLGYQQRMQQAENADLLKHVAVLNQIFDEKSFSWTLAMEDLETVLPAGVQVNSLEPLREKDGHISVHLRVAGPRDRALELTRNLEGSRHFLLPRIVSESAETNGTAAEKMAPISLSSPVNFDLLADYNPAPELRHAHVAEKKSAQPKDQLQPLKPHPGPPAAPGPKSSRPPYLGPPIQPGSKLSKQPGGRP